MLHIVRWEVRLQHATMLVCWLLSLLTGFMGGRYRRSVRLQRLQVNLRREVAWRAYRQRRPPDQPPLGCDRMLISQMEAHDSIVECDDSFENDANENIDQTLADLRDVLLPAALVAAETPGSPEDLRVLLLGWNKPHDWTLGVHLKFHWKKSMAIDSHLRLDGVNGTNYHLVVVREDVLATVPDLSIFDDILADTGVLITERSYTTSEAFEVESRLEASDLFDSLVVLEHSGRRKPAYFLLCFVSYTSRLPWFASPAEWHLMIFAHLATLVDFRVVGYIHNIIDVPTLVARQFPSRYVENLWCQSAASVDWCESGRGYDPFLENISVTDLEVKPSDIAKGGRGVFATRDIPVGSLLALEECVQGMLVYPRTRDVLVAAFEKIGHPYFRIFERSYLEGYAWSDLYYGGLGAGADPGIMTFVNHGCNSTYNIGVVLDVHELDEDYEAHLEELLEGYMLNQVFNPLGERHHPYWDCATPTHTFIAAGEELRDNYLLYGADFEKFGKYARHLSNICRSKETGVIFQYEERSTGTT